MEREGKSKNSGKGISGKNKGNDMPDMRKTTKETRTIKLTCLTSDLHFRHTAPIARAEKGKDWYDVMDNYGIQLAKICNDREIPLIVAGDIFHIWNSPSELINFVIDWFRKFNYGVYTIPGQHDLPLHNYDDMEKSAYWTLVKSKAINHLSLTPGEENNLYNDDYTYFRVSAYAFPWGKEVTSLPRKNKDFVHLAVIHDYIWNSKSTSFIDAPKDKLVNKWENKLEGYDFALFGDNHKPFHCGEYQTITMNGETLIQQKNKTLIFNHGTFIQQKSDERSEIPPSVGILEKSENDIFLRKIPLNISKDKWEESICISDTDKTNSPLALEFVSLLKKVNANSIDFKDAVTQLMNSQFKNLSPDIKSIIIKSME